MPTIAYESLLGGATTHFSKSLVIFWSILIFSLILKKNNNHGSFSLAVSSSCNILPPYLLQKEVLLPYTPLGKCYLSARLSLTISQSINGVQLA